MPAAAPTFVGNPATNVVKQARQLPTRARLPPMSELFEIRTLFFAGALTGLLSALMLLLTRGLHRRSSAAVTWGAAGLGLSGLAMLCVALRGLVPDALSFIGANTLGPAGMFIMYEGVRRLCHAPPRPLLPAAATAAVLVFQVWLGASPEHQATRLFASAATQALAAALMLPLLLRRVGRDPAGPVSAAVALALAFVVAHGARALWILWSGVNMSPDGQYATGPLQASVVALFVLGPMAQAMVVLAWINGRVAARLRRLATTDELTGLATRRSFFSRLRHDLDRSTGGERVAGLLMIDLDNFKRINDLYGHRVGDRALAHFGATLRRTLRAGDFAGRYGGEEFCALVSRSSAAEIREAAERIRRTVAESVFEHEGHRIGLSVSIGVASTDEHADVEALLAGADRRVYLAKSMGRDRVVATDPPPDPERRSGKDRRSAANPPSPGGAATEFDTTILLEPQAQAERRPLRERSSSMASANSSTSSKLR